jgi:hypothetical protein
MLPNGARVPAAATLPEPLVDVTFFAKFVIVTPLSLTWPLIGVANANAWKIKKDNVGYKRAVITSERSPQNHT